MTLQRRLANALTNINVAGCAGLRQSNAADGENMKQDRRTFLKTTLMTTGAVMGGGLHKFAFAADTIRWDMADEYTEANLSGKAAINFAKLVSERLGDRLAVQYHGGGTLGYKSAEQFDAVEDRAVQSAVTVLTQLGGVDPLFELSSLPFVAQTPDEALLLWQIAKPEYAKVFADYDQVLLWAVPSPPSGIHAKMPITSPEALKGLRIRSYDANSTRTLAAAGAAPLQIAWSDLTPQLSTGGIDALLTSGESAEKLTLWDYVSDFTELNYAMALSVAHVHKDDYDALSDEDRAALEQICAECDKYNWDLMRASIDRAYEVMDDNGMTVTHADAVPQDMFDFLQQAADPVVQNWVEATGDRGQAILDAFRSAKS